jgi:hypothetical protein
MIGIRQGGLVPGCRVPVSAEADSDELVVPADTCCAEPPQRLGDRRLAAGWERLGGFFVNLSSGGFDLPWLSIARFLDVLAVMATAVVLAVRRERRRARQREEAPGPGPAGGS